MLRKPFLEETKQYLDGKAIFGNNTNLSSFLPFSSMTISGSFPVSCHIHRSEDYVLNYSSKLIQVINNHQEEKSEWIFSGIVACSLIQVTTWPLGLGASTNTEMQTGSQVLMAAGADRNILWEYHPCLVLKSRVDLAWLGRIYTTFLASTGSLLWSKNTWAPLVGVTTLLHCVGLTSPNPPSDCHASLKKNELMR